MTSFALVAPFTFVLTARLSYGCIFNKKETLERGDMQDLWQMEGLYEKKKKTPKWTETCMDKTAADWAHIEISFLKRSWVKYNPKERFIWFYHALENEEEILSFKPSTLIINKQVT